jgi:hypothetical protein
MHKIMVTTDVERSGGGTLVGPAWLYVGRIH